MYLSFHIRRIGVGLMKKFMSFQSTASSRNYCQLLWFRGTLATSSRNVNYRIAVELCSFRIQSVTVDFVRFSIYRLISEKVWYIIFPIISVHLDPLIHSYRSIVWFHCQTSSVQQRREWSINTLRRNSIILYSRSTLTSLTKHLIPRKFPVIFAYFHRVSFNLRRNARRRRCSRVARQIFPHGDWRAPPVVHALKIGKKRNEVFPWLARLAAEGICYNGPS